MSTPESLHLLISLEGGKETFRYHLEKTDISFGSGDVADLWLDAPDLEAIHGRILRLESGSYQIEAGEQGPSLRIDGEPVKSVLFRPGRRVDVGSVSITCLGPGGPFQPTETVSVRAPLKSPSDSWREKSSKVRLISPDNRDQVPKEESESIILAYQEEKESATVNLLRSQASISEQLKAVRKPQPILEPSASLPDPSQDEANLGSERKPSDKEESDESWRHKSHKIVMTEGGSEPPGLSERASVTGSIELTPQSEEEPDFPTESPEDAVAFEPELSNEDVALSEDRSDEPELPFRLATDSPSTNPSSTSSPTQAEIRKLSEEFNSKENALAKLVQCIEDAENRLAGLEKEIATREKTRDDLIRATSLLAPSQREIVVETESDQTRVAPPLLPEQEQAETEPNQPLPRPPRKSEHPASPLRPEPIGVNLEINPPPQETSPSTPDATGVHARTVAKPAKPTRVEAISSNPDVEPTATAPTSPRMVLPDISTQVDKAKDVVGDLFSRFLDGAKNQNEARKTKPSATDEENQGWRWGKADEENW